MQTTLEPKTTSRPKNLAKAKERLAESKRQQETLDQTKARLIQTQARAKERGIQFPAFAGPTTLYKVQNEIERLEQEIFSAGLTLPPKAEIKPAPKTAGRHVLERAREFLGNPMPSALFSTPAKPITSQAIVATADPQDMSATELEARIEGEKDSVKRKALFRELLQRERGTPRQATAERTAEMTILELAKEIENTKDPVDRRELFGILTQRSRKN